jgi:hypothetical protein
MIRFACACGRQLQVKDELAGRKVRCPGCAVTLRVPEGADGGKTTRTMPPRPDSPAAGNKRGENAAAVADLRRRLGRLNAWRWFFLLLMPLGFLLPCSAGIILGSMNPQAQGFTAAQAFGIAAFVLPLVGLAGWLLMAGDRATCKTALAVAAQAESLGYRFSVQPSKALLERLRSFRMFEDADHHFGLNCVSGEHAGHRFSLLEYRTAYRAAPNPYGTTINNQTVVTVEGLDKELPQFRIGPKTWLSRVVEFLGAPTIRLAAPREFTRKFIVCGEGQEALQDLLNPEMLELIMEADGIVEMCDGSLLFYRHNALVEPEQYEDTIGLAVRMTEVLGRRPKKRT